MAGATQSEMEMMSAFQNLQSKNDISEVLKELFDEGKIYMIGDLSKDEIKLATRIFMIADMKDIEIWKKGLAFYCKIMLSKNRESRREMLRAIGGGGNMGLLDRLRQSVGMQPR